LDVGWVAGHATIPDGLGRQVIGKVVHPARATAIEVAEHVQTAEDRLWNVTIPPANPDRRTV
jgi:hypothetical protein